MASFSSNFTSRNQIREDFLRAHLQRQTQHTQQGTVDSSGYEQIQKQIQQIQNYQYQSSLKKYGVATTISAQSIAEKWNEKTLRDLLITKDDALSPRPPQFSKGVERTFAMLKKKVKNDLGY